MTATSGILLPMEHNDAMTRVAVHTLLFDAATCAQAIELARRSSFTQGRVGTDEARRRQIRRSDTWFFDATPETDFIFAPLYSAVMRLNQSYNFDLTSFATGCQIARYSAEDQGHYDWHIDLGIGRFSRRKLSLSVQLSPSDAYEGGDLEFHLSGLNRNNMRQQGTLIAFPSFLQHRVTPVTRGERFSLVVWVDGPPYR